MSNSWNATSCWTYIIDLDWIWVEKAGNVLLFNFYLDFIVTAIQVQSTQIDTFQQRQSADKTGIHLTHKRSILIPPVHTSCIHKGRFLSAAMTKGTKLLLKTVPFSIWVFCTSIWVAGGKLKGWCVSQLPAIKHLSCGISFSSGGRHHLYVEDSNLPLW